MIEDKVLLQEKESVLQQEEAKELLHEQKSNRKILYVVTLLSIALGFLLAYPRLKASIQKGTFRMQYVLLAFGIYVIYICLELVVYAWIRKRKQDELNRVKLLQEKIKIRAIQQVEEEKAMTKGMMYSLEKPAADEAFPIYRAKNLATDPYSPREKGYAKMQAMLGYPRDIHIGDLTEPIEFDVEATSISPKKQQTVSKDAQYTKFVEAMQGNGLKYSESELPKKFEEYQQFQKMQASILMQSATEGLKDR